MCCYKWLVSGEYLFSILIFCGLKSSIKSVRYQSTALLKKSRYCSNSYHEPEMVPVSALPRVNEHPCRINCSRKIAYHAVFRIVKCKMFITMWLHLICIFNCTYNNRHSFPSYLYLRAVLCYPQCRSWRE